jgi:hypothetical protein
LPWTRTLLFGFRGYPLAHERSPRPTCRIKGEEYDRPNRGPVPLWPLFDVKKTRQRPTLPHSCPCSTIGTSGLNFRVRNGNGCGPAVKVTGILIGVTKIAFFCLDKLYGQASRSISTGQLNASLRLHLQPINLVVYEGPLALAGGRSYLGACFLLICFQQLSRPNVATQRCPWRDNWYTRGSSIQVLSYYGQPPSNLLRLPWIGTELSRDVLNPAHVPL